MHVTTNELAEVAAVDFATSIVPLFRAELGPGLLGAYLMGSLAHGGFSSRYSDIDLAVVTEAGLSTLALDDVRGRAIELSADWGPKLSVYWTDKHFRLGRFPPLDRIDYLDHAVALTEQQRTQPSRPSVEEIRGYLADAPLANWTVASRRFADADILEPRDRKTFLRALLYPARFCYSWMTGRMGSNDDAVAFLRKADPALLDLGLIASALECRQANADPDHLFSARSLLRCQVDACKMLVSGRAFVRPVA
jgi:hypothetical protein